MGDSRKSAGPRKNTKDETSLVVNLNLPGLQKGYQATKYLPDHLVFLLSCRFGMSCFRFCLSFTDL